MKIEIDIPTPNCCIDCKFHTVTSRQRYGGWVVGCMLRDDILMEVRDALKTRAPECPGEES